MTDRPKAEDVTREIVRALFPSDVPAPWTDPVLPIIRRALWQAETAALERAALIDKQNGVIVQDGAKLDEQAKEIERLRGGVGKLTVQNALNVLAERDKLRVQVEAADRLVEALHEYNAASGYETEEQRGWLNEALKAYEDSKP